MAVTHDEMTEMHNRLVAAHGDEAIELASMISFFWHTTVAHGPLREINFAVLMDCVRSHMQANNIRLKAFEHALHDVDRASETLSYLARLPD